MRFVDPRPRVIASPFLGETQLAHGHAPSGLDHRTHGLDVVTGGRRQQIDLELDGDISVSTGNIVSAA